MVYLTLAASGVQLVLEMHDINPKYIAIIFIAICCCESL